MAKGAARGTQATAQQSRHNGSSGTKLRTILAVTSGRHVNQVTEADIEKWIARFIQFCRDEYKLKKNHRDIMVWFDPNGFIYNKKTTGEPFVEFVSRDVPGFSWGIFTLGVDDFATELARLFKSRLSVIMIDLPVPLGNFSADDQKFLCGIYEMYRYSFANNGEVNIDIVIIKPDQNNINRLFLDMIVEPIDVNGRHEIFSGHMYKYGRVLLAVPVLQGTDQNIARVRRMELPDHSGDHVKENRIKIGIISGNSIYLHGPVAAKCLMSKVSNATSDAVRNKYMPLVTRYDANQIYPAYRTAIDDRGDNKFVLHIGSDKPDKPRPRESNPALPEDDDDPYAIPKPEASRRD